jgi:small basic protein (TIGR04137 family)
LRAWFHEPENSHDQEKSAVSIDSTLRRSGRLIRSRNVLTREERIQRLKEQERFGEDSSPLGLPKVRIVKTVVGKKKKKEKKEDDKKDDKKKKK